MNTIYQSSFDEGFSAQQGEQLLRVPNGWTLVWIPGDKPGPVRPECQPEVRSQGDRGIRTEPGSFAVQITDPLCPWNEGTWRFQTVDGELQVNPAETADCTVSIQALTTLVYGTHDPGDFCLRGWGNPSSRVQGTMREMFPRLLPYMHDMF